MTSNASPFGIVGMFQSMQEIDLMGDNVEHDACESCTQTGCHNNPNHQEWAPIEMPK